MRIVSFAFLAAITVAACASEPRDLKTAHDKGRGVARVYPASVDQALAAAHAALKWNDAGALEDHRGDAGETYVLSNTDSSQPSYNMRVGVWLEPMNQDKTRVSVIVLSDEYTGYGGPNEQGVQKDIATAMNLVKAGQPLPDKRP